MKDHNLEKFGWKLSYQPKLVTLFGLSAAVSLRGFLEEKKPAFFIKNTTHVGQNKVDKQIAVVHQKIVDKILPCVWKIQAP